MISKEPQADFQHLSLLIDHLLLVLGLTSYDSGLPLLQCVKHRSKYIRLLSGEFVGLKYIKRHNISFFGIFGTMFQILKEKKKKKGSELPLGT